MIVNKPDFSALYANPGAAIAATLASTFAEPLMLAQYLEARIAGDMRRQDSARASTVKREARRRAAIDEMVLEVMQPHLPARTIVPPKAAVAQLLRLLGRKDGAWLRSRGFDKVPDRRTLYASILRIHKKGITLVSRMPRPRKTDTIGST